MNASDANNEKWSLWSARQRRALLVVLLPLLAWWGWRAYRNPTIIDYPQTGPGLRASELEDKLDPNMATAAELAALPAIGPKAAQQIVTYREGYRRGGREGQAFANPTDLLKVPGIGFNTLQELLPYLKFSSTGAPDAHRRLK
jgi:competence ComEA-like helix-hairpin-helix protein